MAAKVFAVGMLTIVVAAMGLLLLAFVTEKLCYAIYKLRGRIRTRRKSGR